MNRNRMTPRERALYDVQAHAFAAKEWQLFLDTHPRSREALRALSSQTNEAREAARRYEERFGPLTVESAAEGDRYRWIENPWPWEGEAQGDVDL